MTKRLNYLFSFATEGDVFLDVGCDHGLITKQAVLSGKYKQVIASDISRDSLQKAKELLKNYSNVKFYLTDGFTGITEDISLAFIAGMGGEEISKIISSAEKLPQKMILSPQKNAEKVRKTLVKCGYKILVDKSFSDKKVYSVIVCEKGKDFYTEKEYLFGRDNLLTYPKAFIKDLNDKLKTYRLAISSASEQEKQELTKKISLIEGVLNEVK